MWYVGKTKNQKPAMTGNGKHTTYKSGDDWGMVNMALFYCFRQAFGGCLLDSWLCLCSGGQHGVTWRGQELSDLTHFSTFYHVLP